VNRERDFPDGTRIVSAARDDGTTDVSLQLAGQVVSRTLIFPMLMRVGEAIVRMDGIGSVATDEAHRYRGYSRRVLEAAVELMRAGDAAISTLYGIPDFYPKYGYATAGANHTVVLTIAGDDVPTAVLPKGWALRPWTAGDREAVQRLYQLGTRSATGAVPRPSIGELDTDHGDSAIHAVGRRAWDALQRLDTDGVDDACRVLVNPEGEVVAYAWLGRQGWWVQQREDYVPEAFHIGEAMARDPEAADVLVAACREWARDVRPDAGQIEIIIPPEGPVAHAAAYAGAAFVKQHTREGEFMARVLDTGRLMHQLLPELSERVRCSCATLPVKLAIRTGEGTVALSMTPDGVSIDHEITADHLVADMPQTMLARLSLGAFPVRDLAARNAPDITPEVLDVLEALFPQRHLHIYPMDRF
jgi:predicted N-acetyltransferase YhbS